MPDAAHVVELPSFMSKGRPMRCLAQPFETQTAEKLLQVLTRQKDDTRMKAYHDLHLLLHRDLDLGDVARELLAVMEHRGLELSLLADNPNGLDLSDVMELSRRWAKFADGKRNACQDFFAVICDIKGWYADLRQAVIAELAARTPHGSRRVPENVVSLDAERRRRAFGLPEAKF